MSTLPFSRSVVAVATLLLIASIVLPAATADEATNANLLERGSAALQEAQRFHFAGQIAASRVQARRATLLFEQVETQRDRDPEAAFLLIQAAVFAGDASAARRWLDTYGRRTLYGEKDPNLHYARGLVYLILEQRSAAAVEALEQMRRVSPRRSDRGRDTLYYQALVAEGGRLIGRGEAKLAIPLLQKAARAALALGDPRKALTARSNVGIAFHLSGQAEEARQVFARLAKEDPGNLVASFHLGLALTALDRPAEATEAYRGVEDGIEAGKAPDVMLGFLRQAHLRRAWAERSLAESTESADDRKLHLEAALRSLEIYVKEAPKDARGHYALGSLLYGLLARPYEAVSPLETAYRLDPVCDASLTLLIEIARRHPAPSSGDAPTPDAEAQWQARLAAWEKDYAANRTARATKREARARASLEGDDGCR